MPGLCHSQRQLVACRAGPKPGQPTPPPTPYPCPTAHLQRHGKANQVRGAQRQAQRVLPVHRLPLLHHVKVVDHVGAGAGPAAIFTSGSRGWLAAAAAAAVAGAGGVLGKAVRQPEAA